MKHTKHTVKHTLLALSLSATATVAYGDMGSKYQEQHKRHGDSSSKSPKAIPFDFNEIAGVVGSMHLGSVEEELGGHIEQAELEALPPAEAFIEAFEEGDELFEIQYNALDGVGVNVGNGKRFSSIPRLDLSKGEAWANVSPNRNTGPNGNSCLGCHNDPVADGAGGVNDNTIRIDPERRQKGFIERQTPHIFGMGGVQLIAEEMTTDLQALRDAAVEETCESGESATVALLTKGVDFGSIQVSCDRIRYRGLEGVDRDLVVKPFEWKGLTAFVRDFVRGATHQELGMQPTELVGDADGDFDGITNEFSVGDVTALAVYVAGQQRPSTRLELNQITDQLTEEELDVYGLPLSTGDIASIENGEVLFSEMQCASCHTPSMTVANTVFSEPSTHPAFRDDVFPAAEVAMPEVTISFDITSDIFVNEFDLPSGQTLGNFESGEDGGAIIRLFGDLKRHDMGSAMAEDIDEGNVGASVFMTENLWGVGSTPPYLHDGRASTLTEAIMYHGGDAEDSKDLFASASTADQEDVIAFLNNLVLFLEGE